MIRRLVSVSLVLIVLSRSGYAQSTELTARQYYNELYRAGGLDQFADEYICFRDEELPNFFTLGRSETLKHFFESANGMKSLSPKMRAGLRRGFLMMVNYKKGISGNIEYLDYDASKREISDELELPGNSGTKHTPVTYALQVNWQTLRFILSVRRKGSLVPLGESSGRCETIRADVPQHSGKH